MLSPAHPMTPASLRAAALAAGGYATPSLNDVLIAPGRGFTAWRADGDAASPLAAYVDLQALHLDRNALDGFDGAPRLPRLACLFLPCNALTSLAGLAAVAPALATLDVSANQLTSLAGVPPTVSTLRAAHNPLKDGKGDADNTAHPLATLPSLPHLTTLDVAHCGLTDGAALLAVAGACPALRCLYVDGNPCLASVSRRTLVAACPRLTYLNDAPVFGGERAAADGWREGGEEGGARAAAAWDESVRKRVAAVEGGLIRDDNDKENAG